MSAQVSRVFRLRARGPVACFSRPEMKVERVSYEVMTPSAARGLLESVLWKPAIRWQVHEVAVLAPIQWVSFRRNEVKQRMSPGTVFFADHPDRRTQRNTVALKNVDYVVSASFRRTEHAGPDDNVRKFEEMFERRLERGQTFQAPYLGCREFAAAVEPAPPPEEVKPITTEPERRLGWMFYDFDYRNDGVVPLFFDATLSGGRLRVPPLEDVLREQKRGGNP
ncbi:type I-C CRISPR-associated protein Cas5c [Corallococcus sp. EGB]|uniref:type I-C CRISPR-associated protein Cas5c n=1 Tax=Corallococcus sp. EGB TaxID=1521117 RepID=UPI001CC1226E|nr:type I-C CRISPR-associated protein Cas5c [Corallococcus sp. EGB]